LPVTLVDGMVAKTRAYPTNEEIENWLEIVIQSKPPIIINGGCCGPKGCC
jgi:TPP-dependent trihydroxycyclohexane-1,2-dione (THcHDO) dehydratase